MINYPISINGDGNYTGMNWSFNFDFADPMRWDIDSNTLKQILMSLKENDGLKIIPYMSLVA